MLSALPAWRREQALRFRHLSGQRDCALSYLLLCQLLQQEYGITQQPAFVYGTDGKPSLAEFPQIHFSISHCRTAVGCLVTDRPCGLDIESLRPFRQSLVDHTMNLQERQQIAQSPNPQVEFLRFWTQKEALLKLRGTGIVGNLQDTLTPSSLQGVTLTTTVQPNFVYSIAL